MFDPPTSFAEISVTWQSSLFGLADPSFDPALRGLQRTWLDETCWLDHLPRWLEGSDQVFAELVARLPWRHRRVVMFDRLVDEPRLTWWHARGDGQRMPLEVMSAMGAALGRHYGVVFDSVGCNLYRSGSDSVAWHGDRVRQRLADAVVAIVSVGAPRPFLLRPTGGGPSQSFCLGQGDLLVMGGACQHVWQHTVPKVAAAGPRVSITFRHDLPPPPDAVDDAVVRPDRAGHAPRAGARARHPSAHHR